MTDYDAHKEKLEGAFSRVDKYLQQIKDVHNTAIRAANEVIGYDVKKVLSGDDRDKYKKVILEHTKEAQKILGIKGLNSDLEDQILKALGMITEDELDKLLKRPDFKIDDLRNELSGKEGQFAQSHYAGLATKFAQDPKEKEHSLKYFGIDDIVDANLVDQQGMQRYFAVHGTRGQVTKDFISSEHRKTKKDKKGE